MKPARAVEISKRGFPLIGRYVFPKNPKKPLWVNCMLTWRCNARCMMCGIWRKKDVSQAEELTLEEYRTLFSSPLLKNVKHINFAGGEPFLRKDLEVIITSIPKHISVGFPSNGLELDIPKRVRSIVKIRPLGLSISLDACDETHDELRGVRDAGLQAKKNIMELVSLREEGLPLDLSVSVTYMEKNRKKVREVLEYCKKLDVGISIRCVQNIPYLENLKLKNLAAKDIEELRDVEKRLSLFQQFLVEENIRYFFGSAHACHWGSASLSINPYGDVFPCHGTLDQNEFSLGNIKTIDIESIWKSERRKDVLLKINDECSKSCWVDCEVQYGLEYVNPRPFFHWLLKRSIGR
ncbi:MAG: radical SAM protein [Candidatus Altiarchaeota archaeon]